MEEQMMMPEDAGRATDTVLGHLSLGELVIPRAMLDDPEFMQMMQAAFQAYGADIGEFTVGDPANKINPETGYPEFFKFKKFFRKIAPIASIALPILAPGIGSALGGALLGTGAAGSATLGNALIGAGLGGVTGGAKGALLGGAGGAIGANIGSAAGVGASGPTEGSGILGAITRNIPGASELASSISGIGSNIGNAIGTFGGSPISNTVQGPTAPSGILGTLGSTTGLNNSGLLSGLTGTGGGGSTFNSLSLGANILGGLNQDEALKKQRQQLMGANSQQLANLETFDPSNITNDAGYQFNLEQGQQGLNRALGASGNLFSGQALKAASEYNQNYANNALKDAYARWANKTGAQNALYGSGGQIAASTTGGQANNLSQSLASALGTNVGGFSGSQDELLKRLLMKQA